MPNSTSQGRTLPNGIIGPLPMAALERAIIAQSALNRRADANKARRHDAAVR
ncbi:hypothetical protein [Bosea sp. FBZP-16]|uniref:hypothetical protein n=1 Tax=Bosea sp. FBZP-16 TaxID=2065382 RepID=UPI001319B951|nr:hypothetical protein [Bosea sp. FBZP-16]